MTKTFIKQQLEAHPELDDARVAIAEVGGGSTELLYVDAGNVAYSHAFRLGSLRLHESLESLRATQAKLRDIMESEIQRQLENLPSHIPANRKVELIALGSDARFAAKQLLKDWDQTQFGIIKVKQLARFVDEFLELGEDAVVRKYGIPFAEAETSGPARRAVHEGMAEASIGRLGEFTSTVDAERRIGRNKDRRALTDVFNAVNAANNLERLLDPSRGGDRRRDRKSVV